jgi:hypothetical protein
MTLFAEAAFTTVDMVGLRRSDNRDDLRKGERTDARGMSRYFIGNVRPSEVAPVILFRSPNVYFHGYLAEVACCGLGRRG